MSDKPLATDKSWAETHGYIYMEHLVANRQAHESRRLDPSRVEGIKDANGIRKFLHELAEELVPKEKPVPDHGRWYFITWRKSRQRAPYQFDQRRMQFGTYLLNQGTETPEAVYLDLDEVDEFEEINGTY